MNLKKLFRRTPPTPHVIPPHMRWKDEEFFRRAKARHDIDGLPDIRLYFLQSCLRSLASLPGDVAECGVRWGKSALFMNEAVGGARTIWAFDSFEGLSDPVPQDGAASAYPKGRSTGNRFFAVDFEVVRDRLEAEGIRVMRGWIPERFPEVADRQFCLVHVDVDMYEPTLQCLEFFWPRMPRFALLVCDDYGTAAYPGARIAIDEFFAGRDEKPVELPQGQCFVVKR